MKAQAHVLSDSVRSFNSIHDRAKRCEASCLRDGSGSLSRRRTSSGMVRNVLLRVKRALGGLSLMLSCQSSVIEVRSYNSFHI